MELDLTGIHKLAAEQGIDPGTLDDALAEALRLAYLKTPHAARHARVELDERSGNFTVWAADEIPVEPTEDNPYPAPKLGEEYDDTPHDFGRLAAATARQVISQLFRKAEDDKVFGAFSGQKGKLITGIVQQDVKDTSNVHVAVGDVEALLPRREQVPGERYRHGERIRVYVVNVARGLKGPEIVVSRSHPELVRRLFEREVPELVSGAVSIMAIAREAGVDFTISDIDRLSRHVPCICKVAPNTKNYFIEDVHRAGGIPAILGELNRGGLLDPEVHSVHHDSLQSFLDDWDIRGGKALDAADRLFHAAPGGVRTPRPFASLSPGEGPFPCPEPVNPWNRGAADPWNRAPDGACRRCAPQRPATRRIIDSDIVRTIIIPLEVAHG